MPYTCAVPKCRGNYKNGPKVHIFSFPKDKKMAETWVRAIKRDNFTPNQHSKVCELHFRPEDIRKETTYFHEKTGTSITVKLEKPCLHDGAVPKIRLNCSSSSAHSKESPDSKKFRLEKSSLITALAHSIADKLTHTEREFHVIDDLEGKLNFLDRKYWSVVRQQETLIICHIIKCPYPKMSLSLVIEPDFEIHVFYSDVEMHTIGEYKIPSHITDTNTLEDLLDNMRKLDIEEHRTKPPNVIAVLHLVMSFLTLLQDQSFRYFYMLQFIYEQLYLMIENKFDYSAEMMIFSSLLYNCSPQEYRLLRDTTNLILPSYSTIRRLTLSSGMNPVVEGHDHHFLMYIKNKFKLLSEKDITVSLLIDEIHLKPYFNYKSRNVGGLVNNIYEAATSAFAFMLSSVCSKFKDVVHVMPTKGMKVVTLFDIIKQVIIGLEEIGFKVISVITDNNVINKKAMSLFSSPPKLSIVYPHPVQSSRPLFFLFDSVYLLKCIRNNWLAQNDDSKSMIFPKFCNNGNPESDRILKAPFTTLQKLHTLESTSLLKYCHKLTSKALSPTNLEKQNMTLVMQIFNEYIIQKLLTVGKEKCLPNFAEVAEYINIFHTWWTILNVKTPFKGCQLLNNKYANPLTNKSNDQSYTFLNVFCNWLDCWNNIPGICGQLTKETFAALHHTTHAMLELTDYCIEELKMEYILPGKFQTDHLEAKFGQYRQLGSGQYDISIRQVFECDKRTMSDLKLSLPLNNKIIDLTNLPETNGNWDEMTGEHKLDIHTFCIDITEDDIKECSEVLPAILYLAGYCCNEVFKKMKCNSCRNLITETKSVEELPESNSYIQGINRGSLLHPNNTTTHFVLYNYAVVGKLIKDRSFLHLINQQKLAMYITLNILADYDLLFHIDYCDEGHTMEQIERMLVWTSSNALLNNLCDKENSRTIKSLSKKIKLQTFS